MGLSFSVQILTTKLNNYIPLASHPEIPFNYAIPPDCDVRLFWEADKMGILSEDDFICNFNHFTIICKQSNIYVHLIRGIKKLLKKDKYKTIYKIIEWF